MTNITIYYHNRTSNNWTDNQFRHSRYYQRFSDVLYGIDTGIIKSNITICFIFPYNNILPFWHKTEISYDISKIFSMSPINTWQRFIIRPIIISADDYDNPSPYSGSIGIRQWLCWNARNTCTLESFLS